MVLANSVEAVSANISQNIVKNLTQQSKVALRANKGDVDRFYADFYAANPTQSFAWLDDGKITSRSKEVLSLLEKSHYKGLFPKNYHVGKINELVASDLANVEDQQLLDLLMTDAALSYLRDLSVGQPELIVVEQKNWLLPRDKFDSVAQLNGLLSASDLAAQVATVEPKHEQYHLLLDSLAKVLDSEASDEVETTMAVGGKMSLNDQNDKVLLLNNRLIELGYLDSAKKDQKLFDSETKKAVQAFQNEHLLEPDGVVGARTQKELNKTKQDRATQLITNIERWRWMPKDLGQHYLVWRWMPKDLGQHYLVVDIPSFEYYVVKDGVETVRAKTIVGMAQRSTPVFMAPMNHIVFAPYWNVPRSMAVKDKLPQLKKDPERLARSKIRILDKNGNEIDPSMVDWSQYNANNFPYRLRQDPGTYNALGKVKFMFPNEHAIYLHDTPQKSLFGKTERTFSSGCIRIENPVQLAEYFLKDQDWKVDRIQKAYDGSKEQTVRLKEDMRFPVYTIYMTTAVDANGKTVYRSDIYDRDGAMQTKIAKLSLNP
ncbi:L,D-transpeptidase family protein [Wohlfahrtiimonas populi]